MNHIILSVTSPAVPYVTTYVTTRTDMTKMVVACRNFANTPKKLEYFSRAFLKKTKLLRLNI